jgi:hypothetical protein
MGSIPIVRYHAVHSELRDLPIVFIEGEEGWRAEAGWRALATQPAAYFEQLYEEYDKKQWNMEKLNFRYWRRQLFRLCQGSLKQMNNIGQMHHDHLIGQQIIKILKNRDIKNVLDLGTWNGRGSTICFYLGLLSHDREDIHIYSLEVDEERHTEATAFWQFSPNVHPLRGHLFHKGPPSQEEIVRRFPNAVKDWLEVDLKNVKNASAVSLPKIDLVLFDGSEYLTYYEYLLLRDKVNYIFCDDANVDKCRQIKQELLASSEWQCLFVSDERNGVCGFERVRKEFSFYSREWSG